MWTEGEHTEDIAGSSQDDGEQAFPASGMASVMAKILCKNVNSSKSVILAKCKTDRELSRRKKANKSADRVDIGRVEELQSAKDSKDLLIKVDIYMYSLFVFVCCFCSTFLCPASILFIHNEGRHAKESTN